MPDETKVTADFLANFTKAWNDQDLEALMAHMAHDCVFMASVGAETEGTKWTGNDEVRKGFASLWDIYPDAHFEPIGADFIVGDRGCSEWVFTGTKKANGEKIKARGCDVYTFEDGKIKVKNSMRKQFP